MPIQTRLHFLAFTLPLTVVACSSVPDPVGLAPGRSDRPRGGAPVPAITPPDAGPTTWERWSELPSYRVAIARTASQHLAADHEGETLANEAAAAYPSLGPARTLPRGAVLVQRLFAPGATTPAATFAMVKRELAGPDSKPESLWEFVVIDAGGLVTERGALEPCARCHAEAPHDAIFGRAR